MRAGVEFWEMSHYIATYGPLETNGRAEKYGDKRYQLDGQAGNMQGVRHVTRTRVVSFVVPHLIILSMVL